MKRILSRSFALSLCLLLPLFAIFSACSRAPQYTITLSAENSNPGVSNSTLVTATLTNRGAPVPGQNIVFTWMLKGSSQTPQPGPTLTTNANGQVTYTLDNTANPGGHRAFAVTATLENNPSITATGDVRFGDALPPGFIALSEARMNWADAKAFCQQQGGKLPRINDRDSWDGSDSAVIDAFGTLGAKWPAELPKAYYWAGTEYSDRPNYSWGIRAVRDGVIGVISAYAHGTNIHVICVP